MKTVSNDPQEVWLCPILTFLPEHLEIKELFPEPVMPMTAMKISFCLHNYLMRQAMRGGVDTHRGERPPRKFLVLSLDAGITEGRKSSISSSSEELSS